VSSESMCQVARSWVDVGSFHTRLFGVVYFVIDSFREFLDTNWHSAVWKVKAIGLLETNRRSKVDLIEMVLDFTCVF
jgi:hypothetical protein